MFLSMLSLLVGAMTRVELMSNCPNNRRAPLGGSAKT
jgi:hypothetical protein